MSQGQVTDTSNSTKSRKPIANKLVEPKARFSLSETKASAAPTTDRPPVSVGRDASQTMAKLVPDAASRRKDVRPNPGASSSGHASKIEPCTDWTAYTKKVLEKDKKGMDLTTEDKSALMALDHFLESLESPIPSKRNWFLVDFRYDDIGSEKIPYIKISTRCKCVHLMAGEHVYNGDKIKKGKRVRYSLADLAKYIQTEWKHNDCGEDVDETADSESTPTLKVSRTKAL